MCNSIFSEYYLLFIVLYLGKRQENGRTIKFNPKKYNFNLGSIVYEFTLDTDTKRL